MPRSKLSAMSTSWQGGVVSRSKLSEPTCLKPETSIIGFGQVKIMKEFV
jgi:hypothetical protein